MKTHYFNYFNVITSVLFAGWVWSGVFFFVCRARPRHLPLHITYPRNNSIFMHQNYAIFFLWLQLKFIIIKSDSKCIYIFTMNTVRPALCERTRITILFFFYLNTSLSWISLFSLSIIKVHSQCWQIAGVEPTERGEYLLSHCELLSPWGKAIKYERGSFSFCCCCWAARFR